MSPELGCPRNSVPELGRYTSEDLERLQQVLFYRELGFGLEAIRDLPADPGFDRREALRGSATSSRGRCSGSRPCAI
jgi:DNA-binding transcriptional MerR regulator